LRSPCRRRTQRAKAGRPRGSPLRRVYHRACRRPNQVAQSGYQVAADLAHRNRTALISLGIPELVRFDKIRHRSVTNRSLLVVLYLRREDQRAAAVPRSPDGAKRHPGWPNLDFAAGCHEFCPCYKFPAVARSELSCQRRESYMDSQRIYSSGRGCANSRQINPSRSIAISQDM